MAKDVRWKLLVATPDDSEAFLIKRLLDGEEIPCRMEWDRTYPGSEQGAQRRKVRVYVALEDFEASQEILESDDREDGPV
ncbi:MAG: DUF2007 domain-containing protein [bacterium]|nr:MAG: DUF2007 domain-containing protein [bacterium]